LDAKPNPLKALPPAFWVLDLGGMALITLGVLSLAGLLPPGLFPWLTRQPIAFGAIGLGFGLTTAAALVLVKAQRDRQPGSGPRKPPYEV
jgi:hypothetical protein